MTGNISNFGSLDQCNEILQDLFPMLLIEAYTCYEYLFKWYIILQQYKQFIPSETVCRGRLQLITVIIWIWTMKIVFPKSPLMHDVCNQLINAWRMLRVALHTSSKYEFIVSHCHLVKSWGQYQTHILKRYESKLLFQKQVYLLGREQSSILSILEVADHSQNLQHAPTISHRTGYRQFFCKLKILKYKPELLESSSTQTAM